MLPHFLIIGAMKCGTTSLYRDLLTNPAVFMPDDKEPNALCDDHALSAAGRAEYENLFRPAGADQICGEASTRYTKAPDETGVPQRARDVLGHDVRLVYVVREPAARIASHHHHSFFDHELETRDVNESLDRHPALLNFSRYAMQATLWIDVFGCDSLRIVRFEDYIKDRRSTIGALCGFLDIDPRPELIEIDEVYNKSEEKPITTTGWRKVIHNPIYRNAVRPFLSTEARDRLRGALLPKAREELPAMQPKTVEKVYDYLADDLNELQDLMGFDRPVWDRSAAVAKFADRLEGQGA